MATQNLNVERGSGWVAVPVGATHFTQNGGGKSFWAEAAFASDLAIVDSEGKDITGLQVFSCVPYTIDPAKKYFLKAADATCHFGIILG